MAKDVGNGYALAYDMAGGSTFTAVAQVASITPPPTTMGKVDVTTLDSTFTEYRPDELEDYGEMAFDLLLDPDLAGHQVFRTNIVLGTLASWRLTPPGNTGTNTRTFTGFLTNYAEGQVTPKGSLTATCSVCLTSAVTYVD